MLDQLAQQTLTETEVQAVLKEMVRSAVLRMIEDEEAPVPSASEEDRLAAIKAGREEIKTALRSRDCGAASPLSAAAAQSLGMVPDALSAPTAARQVLLTERRLLQLEQEVMETFDDPVTLGRSLLADHRIGANRAALRPPMLVSEAVKRAVDAAASESARKVDVTGQLMLRYFADIAITTLTHAKMVDFPEAVWWLPKNWGHSHWKNLYNQPGKETCPFEDRKRPIKAKAQYAVRNISIEPSPQSEAIDS